MLYDDDFVVSLPAELSESVVKVLEVLINKSTRTGDEVLEARDLIAALMDSHGEQFDASLRGRQDSENVYATLRVIHNQHATTLGTRKSVSRQEAFSTLLGRAFCYNLSDADSKRIQELINELRGLITDSPKFEEDHRRRILERLERLQQELHRRISNLDRFYGLIGDAGVLLGKFGTDAKPFVDRIREIVEIAWRSQAAAEQLPASAKPALLTTDSQPSQE